MKTVKISRIKNFFIVMLTVAAVYQTATLWLGNYSGHNFFYSLFSESTQIREQREAPSAVLDAEKLIVGYGNRTFSVMYPGLGGTDIVTKTNGYISDMLVGGSVETLDTAFDEFISQKCVVLDFAFDVLPSQYFMGYGNIQFEGYSSISSINQIIAIPSAGYGYDDVLYLVDSKMGKSCRVILSAGSSGEKLYEAINSVESLNADKLKYISTSQSGFNIFNESVFVPQWSQSSYSYAALSAVDSFERFGKDRVMALENGTSSFFKNSSAATIIKDDTEVYTISDNDVIVKYYPNGILEYYYYAYDGNTTEQNLSTAYYACKSFLEKDIGLNTRVFLAEAELNSGGIVFSFDYSVNDMPVYFSNELKEQINAEHAIEVFVEGNTVRRYRRYACDYELSSSREKIVETDFLGAMNRIMSLQSGNVTEIEDLVMGYCAKNGSDIGLKWFMAADGSEYITETAGESSGEEAQ